MAPFRTEKQGRFHGQRLLGAMETFHNCEKNFIWWGDDFAEKLE